MSTRTNAQQGQALILLVATFIGIFALVALAIDAGNAFSDRRKAQNAADAAALAAALAKIKSQDYTAAALTRAANNGYGENTAKSSVEVINPPGAGCNRADEPYAGNNEYIQVVIHSIVDTYFAPILGIDQLHNCVESIAHAKPPTTAPIAYGSAIASLNLHDCRSFWVHGTSDTVVTGSGVFVNSDCSTGAFQAFDQSGHGSLTAPNICVVGGATYGAGDVIPPPTTGCPAILYPPEYLWPSPSCLTEGTNNGTTLTPGNIPGSWLNGDKILQPGSYCISGDVSINSNDHITGTGVLLYFINGGIYINGDAEVNISAQTTGDYAGLLIYLSLMNSNNVVLNGNGNSAFTGTILAPASNIQVNGSGSAYGYHSQIIGYTVDLSGSAVANIYYNDNENYDITLPPSIEITR